MTAEIASEVARVRGGDAGLFYLGEGQSRAFARGVIEVTGRDAPRWLDGMVSNDITRLSPGGPNTGCYALLLTPKGRIVADLHVLARDGCYWLETARDAVEDVIARLRRYIVADDVELRDRSGDFARLGVEGARGAALLEAAAAAPLEPPLPDSWCSLEIAGTEVVAARFGWSGEDAYQLFVPAANLAAVDEALRAPSPSEAAAGHSLAAPNSLAALEVLRIEAGVPLLGPELHEEIFPDEARLDLAISRKKGCYTGQEIVARLYSRGAVNHLLVGLAFESETPPAPATLLLHSGRRTGEITSACTSPSAGAIGLGYVRREQAEPGTVLEAGSVRARVVPLPIVPPSVSPGARARGGG